MSKIYAFLITCGFLLLGSLSVHATHIRAGEITATSLSADSLKWKFVLTVYTDYNAKVQNDSAVFEFGDGTNRTVWFKSRVHLPDYSSYVTTYETTHLYSAPGVYLVKYSEQNRKGGVLNISRSDENSFYIETKIIIDPGLAKNSTPILTYLPLDIAPMGQLFEHNPGAFDADGDSLSYRLIVPRQKYNGVVMPVSGYRDPATFGGQSLTGGPTTFTLDEKTGYITWDTPNVIGEYNVAFEIIEWRKMPDRDNPGKMIYRQIGFVVRDMQILVKDANNKPPKLTLPMDTCVIAGDSLSKFIFATDPDNDRITISAYGGPLLTGPNKAVFKSAPNQPSPANGLFTWQTSCKDIRNQPHEVLFRAEDQPIGKIKLVDLQTYRIRVVGPAPTNLAALPGDGVVHLTWDAYTCANASLIEIYRKEGPSGFVPDACMTGIPAGLGYVKVGEVNGLDTTFTDTGKTTALKRGIEYCYRIVARFPEPAGGESIASMEVCARLSMIVPLMVKASVLAFDQSNGSMEVAWTKPLELDTQIYEKPFRYTLLRAESKAGAEFKEIYSTTNLNDTSFVDKGLNTNENGLMYDYKVAFYTSDTALKGFSDIASSVFIKASPANKEIRLEWTARVPWNNDNQTHMLYRESSEGEVALIQTVEVKNNNYTFTDKGTAEKPLKCNTPYYYYVITKGQYDDPLLYPELIYNKSQRIVAMAMDTAMLAAPVLALDTLICGNCKEFSEKVSFVNTLSWHTADSLTSSECYPLITGYNIYYSPHEEDSLQLLAFSSDTLFLHENLSSLAGCYQVAAVDVFGQEGPRSNKVCKDNCEFFELPNVFTPNGDNINEEFRPMCFGDERLIESVNFSVYNRWGMKVYSSQDNVLLQWKGTSSDSAPLPVGTYFYVTDVKFKRLRKNEGYKTLKGWVQILR